MMTMTDYNKYTPEYMRDDAHDICINCSNNRHNARDCRKCDGTGLIWPPCPTNNCGHFT